MLYILQVAIDLLCYPLQYCCGAHASKILNDETDFKAILPYGEMTVIVHTILSLECYDNDCYIH